MRGLGYPGGPTEDEAAAVAVTVGADAAAAAAAVGPFVVCSDFAPCLRFFSFLLFPFLLLRLPFFLVCVWLAFVFIGNVHRWCYHRRSSIYADLSRAGEAKHVSFTHFAAAFGDDDDKA